MVEVGTWKNFDEIEESLILDELLLLTERLAQKRKDQYRIALMAQGVDMDENNSDDDDDLPEEILEAERKYKAEKEAYMAEEGRASSFAEGLGYKVVS